MNRKQRRQMARLEPASALRQTSSSSAQRVGELFARAVQHFQAGRLMEAMQLYQQALLADPKHIGSLHHLGVVAIKIGRPEIAVDLIEQAIALNEANPTLHHDICFALSALDRHADAVRHAQRAIALKPDYTNAYLLLGDALLKLRRFDDAIGAYRQSLARDPAHAEAHNNLAEALFAQERLDEAAASFKEALRLKPDLVTAYNNLAMITFLGGDVLQALNVVMQGLQVNETAPLKSMFVTCARHAKSIPVSVAFRHYLVRAMTEPWGRPGATTTAAVTLVKQDPHIRQSIDRAVAAWPARLSCAELFGAEGLRATAGDRVLRALLQNTHAKDVALERFLTLARSALLDAITATAAPDGTGDDDIAAFACMLAQQCFINEYVFACGPDEQARVALLRGQVTAALRIGDPIAALPLAVIASYEPLYAIAGFEALAARSWPLGFDGLLTQQVREPLAERALRNEIRRLTSIEDDVSVLVQNQYEESPYPRWVKCALDETARPIDDRMRNDFPHARYRPVGRMDGLDMLIAGCGTGQQAVMMARQYEGARILAVDLSLASLCYAKYRTDTLGLTNIEYGQADILKLASIGRQFDVIACSGVLHHLGDPLEGWRVLLSILRPNGIMHIGLYSQLARTDVVATRDFLAMRGYRATIDDIRRCRQDILALDQASPARGVAERSDFYTTSNCRDLILHVQEHQFTLPRIKDFLANNGLELLGFQHDADVLLRYRRQFPDDPACTNLDHWHVYEQQNPRTFTGMYQFVVQKHA
ncbi:MAG: tetratricopeptide repeat protein [Xanthobacteraceae bacterium]|nr:tetratricopeptide repeat protein [Xanthobacteraceae bacterium]